MHPDAGDAELMAVTNDGLGHGGRRPDHDRIDSTRDRPQVVVARVPFDDVGIGVDREDLVAALTEPPVDGIRPVPLGMSRDANDRDALLGQEILRRFIECGHRSYPPCISAIGLPSAGPPPTTCAPNSPTRLPHTAPSVATPATQSRRQPLQNRVNSGHVVPRSRSHCLQEVLGFRFWVFAVLTPDPCSLNPQLAPVPPRRDRWPGLLASFGG